MSKGDLVDFLESGAENIFATAKLTDITEKVMGQLTKKDKEGHEVFESEEQMYTTYSKYYGRNVGPDTSVKIIRFELLQQEEV